jgi:predicted Rossmann fold nucleotide-binding protein DprA/Smf involved in DNA uptake
VNIAESQFTPVKSKVSIETIVARKMKINSIQPEYKDIYKILLDKPLNINEICTRTKRDIGYISSSLTMLELEEYVEQLPGKLFRILE